MNIYLVRHGQSQSNISGRYCGVTDVPLTSAGEAQSKRTARYLRGLKADRVYSSPLSRASFMTKLICEQALYTPQLCERNFGAWEGLTYEDICRDYPKEAEKWNADWINYRIPGGESARDVENRCAEFLSRIKTDDSDCIVITHSGIIRNIITLLLEMEAGQVWRFCADNGSVSHIEITDGYAVLRSLNYIP